MFCTKCGNKLDVQQRFCENCGEPVINEDGNISNYNTPQEEVNKDEIKLNNFEENLKDNSLHNKIVENKDSNNEDFNNKNFNNGKAYVKEENKIYASQERSRNTEKNKKIIIIAASIIVAIGLLGSGAYVVKNKYGDKIAGVFNKSSEETLVDNSDVDDQEDKKDNIKEDEKKEEAIKNEGIAKEDEKEVKWELDKDRLEKSPRLKDDYVISTSNTESLTFSQLNDYTIDELFIARNEMLARYGYSFNGKENLKNYFQSKSWYKENPSFDGTMPTDIERVNYEMIASVEYLKKAYEKSGDIQSDYVLERSNKSVQSEYTISQLTDWELVIARNEIYARYGLNFSTKEIKDHFLKKSWFKINDEVGNDLALTEIENKNLQLILAEEKKRMNISFDHDL